MDEFPELLDDRFLSQFLGSRNRAGRCCSLLDAGEGSLGGGRRDAEAESDCDDGGEGFHVRDERWCVEIVLETSVKLEPTVGVAEVFNVEDMGEAGGTSRKIKETPRGEQVRSFEL